MATIASTATTRVSHEENASTATNSPVTRGARAGSVASSRISAACSRTLERYQTAFTGASTRASCPITVTP